MSDRLTLDTLVSGTEMGASGARARVSTAVSAAAVSAAAVTVTEASLRRFLTGLPGVDAVGADARAAALATRSVKGEAKRQAIDQAIAMVDLTTLEGADTPGKVTALCAKACRPDPTDPTVGPVAAVCVYPDLVPAAVAALALSPPKGPSPMTPNSPSPRTPNGPSAMTPKVRVASVATSFPSGRSWHGVKMAEVTATVAAGADEIDMVIDRGAFLSGRFHQVFLEVQAIKQACGAAQLKVILETGELATYDNVRRASWLAMLAGADFIKTSTGKMAPAATLPVALVMLEAVRDFHDATGRPVGVKVAGGIRTTRDAIRYLVLVHETVGDAWLTADRFRFGASTLLNDLLMQRAKQDSGRYAGPDYFTVD